MKKKAVLKKLYTLDVLINQTEPDIMPDSHLFSAHTIENQNNIMMIEEGRTTSRDIKDIMQKSNVMWTMRNKIKNGEWETLEPMYELEMELRDLCQQGHKIQAIKRYRSYMDRNYNIDITLKIAKYTIDALSEQKPVDLMTGVKVD
jgi:ribosomal protein L7/L12